MISSEVTTQAQDVARRVTETLNDKANFLRDAAEESRYQAEDYILNNPWQAMAIVGATAAVTGFFVGFILGRKL